MPTERDAESLKLGNKKSSMDADSLGQSAELCPDLKSAISEHRFPNNLMARLFEEKSTVSERSILRAALVAWMFCPKDPSFIQQAAHIRATTLLLAKYKRIAKPGMSDRERFMSLLKKSSNRWLVDEAFFGMGGVNALLHGRSRREFSDVLKIARGEFAKVLPLVQILHIYVDKVAKEPGRREFKPSLEAAIKVYMSAKGVTIQPAAPKADGGVVDQAQNPVQQEGNKSKKTMLGTRQLKQYWSAFRPSLPFLYAASVLRDQEGQFLGEQLTKRDFGKKLSPSEFNEFLRVAKYIHEKIFMRMASSENWDYSFPTSLEAIAIEPPDVSPEVGSAIRKVFVDRRRANTKG